FFVLSGFLITGLLLDEHEQTGGVSLRGFYRRRVRRLMPVALAGIVLSEGILILVAAQQHTFDTQMLVGAFALFYGENLAHFLHPPVTTLLGHYWSLSQEEQFYFIWPPILGIALARRIAPRRLLGILGVAVAAVAVHRAVLAGDWWRVYYAPDTHADGILL